MKLLEMAEKLHHVLCEAATERDLRPYPGWVEHELAVMHQAVNRERAALGKIEAPLSLIYKVEQRACGHSNYASKFALYCAKIILEDWLLEN